MRLNTLVVVLPTFRLSFEEFGTREAVIKVFRPAPHQGPTLLVKEHTEARVQGVARRFSGSTRGSESNREKNHDLPGDSCSKTLLQTTVIEKLQDLRARPRDLPGSGFSITLRECDFSIPALGDEFRAGK